MAASLAVAPVAPVVELESGNLKIGEGQRGSLKTRQLDYGDFELYLTEEANGGEASYGFWSGWGGQPQSMASKRRTACACRFPIRCRPSARTWMSRSLRPIRAKRKSWLRRRT